MTTPMPPREAGGFCTTCNDRMKFMVFEGDCFFVCPSCDAVHAIQQPQNGPPRDTSKSPVPQVSNKQNF